MSSRSNANNAHVIRRIKKEMADLNKNPLKYILVRYDEQNPHVCYFVIDSNLKPYTGGSYFGKMIFPYDYPFSKPNIQILTPNGKYETGVDLFLGYGKDNWSPTITIRTLLTVFYASFFWNVTEEQKGSIGSIGSKESKTDNVNNYLNLTNEQRADIGLDDVRRIPFQECVSPSCKYCTRGRLNTSNDEKQEYAKKSSEYNKQNLSEIYSLFMKIH